MNFRKLFFTTTLFLILFASATNCLDSDFFESSHSYSSYGSCHEVSQEFEPFREVESVVATVKERTDDGLLSYAGFSDFTVATSIFAVLFSLYLLSKRRLFRLIYSIPRLFNKWKYILKQGIMHPQVW
ncbi:MAG: hypothetical protein ABEJ24_04955 [Candidatus Magasanikbacteria bacterium]